jgi:hypothetical protein
MRASEADPLICMNPWDFEKPEAEVMYRPRSEQLLSAAGAGSTAET